MHPTVRFAALACAALILPAGAAAADAPKASNARVVMECGRDVATRRAYTREHGQAPVFVTARDVRLAQSRGETWAAPRCMSAREHGRLVQSLTELARAR